MQTNQCKAARIPHGEDIACPTQFRATQTEFIWGNRLEVYLSVLLLLVATVLLALQPHALADGLNHWHWRNPTPFGNPVRGSAQGNGILVAVGEKGVVQISAGGVNWTTAEHTITNSLNAVAFGASLFVAVGDKGGIYTSPDGLTWTSRVSGTATNLLTVQFGNSKYVAGGAGGTVVTSSDAINWTVASAGVPNDLTWSAFGSGRFLMPTPLPSGPSGWPAGTVLASTDGVNWVTNTVNPVETKITTVSYANGKFLAFGAKEQPPFPPGWRFFSSPDGVTWTTMPFSPFAFHDGLFAANNQFIEIGRYSAPSPNSLVRLSPDGENWVQGVLPDNTDGNYPIQAITSVAFIDGKYVLLGNFGEIATSSNGTNWTYVNSRLLARYTQIATGNGISVAVGGAIPCGGQSTLCGYEPPLAVSTNGQSFWPATVGITQALSSVAFGASNFVAVGRSGALHRSTNGTHWATRPSGASSDLASVCYGSNLWVAVGLSGAIVTSPNSLLWTLRTSGTSSHLYGVTCGNGIYVAVGNTGTVLTSPDGIDWTPQFADVSTPLHKVTFGNGRFVAVGGSGTVITSTNGVNWDVQTPATTLELYGVAFGAGTFVAAGTTAFGYDDYGPNVLLRSEDGVTWTPVLTPVAHTLIGVNFDGSTFWITGGRGAILQSDTVSDLPILSGARLPNGHFQLTITWKSGQNYRIQACTNATSWFDLATISNSTPGQVWSDTGVASSSTRLYRVVSP